MVKNSDHESLRKTLLEKYGYDSKQVAEDYKEALIKDDITQQNNILKYFEHLPEAGKVIVPWADRPENIPKAMRYNKDTKTLERTPSR